MQTIIRNALIVNEGDVFKGCLVIDGQRIDKVFSGKEAEKDAKSYCRINHTLVDATGMILIPGIIDDHVHFREPGQTHKGTMTQESRSALLGGVTSVLDMPNNVPPAISARALEEKYGLGASNMFVNYGFYMGSSNNNIEEVLKTGKKGCGLKIFMGSSTGNMLVDDPAALDTLFGQYQGVIAVHCEEESIIRENLTKAVSRFGDDIPMILHNTIRSREACIASTRKALEIAIKHNTRLHILHVTTEEEIELIRKARRINPRISCEAVLPHLMFTQADYVHYGTQIKCNPSIKTAKDRDAILEAIENGNVQTVGSDHAPHSWEEKQNPYVQAPSGIPIIQHFCQIMMENVHNNTLSVTSMAGACCHWPAQIFDIKDRGFIREGYYADLVLINPEKEHRVTKSQLEYACKWTPLEGTTFQTSVSHVFVNGTLAAENGQIIQKPPVFPIS